MKKDIFEWNPWIVWEKFLKPPCPYCRFLRPSAEYTVDGEYDGIKMCHAKEMFHDFSCFKARGAEEEEK